MNPPALVPTGVAQIQMTRALVLKHALRIEVITGRKKARLNAYAITKEEFNFKGSKLSVLEQLEEWIGDKLSRIYVPPEDGRPHSVYDTA